MTKMGPAYFAPSWQLQMAKAKPEWLELEWVEERTDNRTSWVAVTLGCNGEIVTGLSPSLSTKRCRYGVSRAALATLRAIELFVDHRFACELVDVEHVHATGVRLMLVRVRVHVDGDEVELFGSAPVEGDLMRASVNATLDATNLYIDFVLSQPE
jgi:hypothetical protein